MGIGTASRGTFSSVATHRSSLTRIALIAIPTVLLLLSSALVTDASSGTPAGSHATDAASLPGYPLAPGSNFTTYLGNLERTSAASGEQLINLTTAPSLHVLWSYTAGGAAVQSQPVEQDGVVYVGGESGYEYALYATNGTLLWKTYLGIAKNDTECALTYGITSTATVNGTELYVDGGYPYLYELNSSTGAIQWRSGIGGTSGEGYYDWSSPLIYDGHAYVGISSQCDKPLVKAGVDEFSAANGTLLNSFDSSSPKPNGSSIWGSPSVNPATNTIFVTTGNEFGNTPTTYSESLIALDATTLKVVRSWQVPTKQVKIDSDFGVTPTLFTPTGGQPMVTVANKNGVLYAFDQASLTKPLWQVTICNVTGNEHISTAWGGEYVYAVSTKTTIGTTSYASAVWALNPLTGKVIWKKGFTVTSANGYATPLYVDQALVVPDGPDFLVFNATTGAVVYQDTLSGYFGAAASVSRGELFVGSSNDDVYAFDLALKSVATQSIATGAPPLSDSFHVTPSGGLPSYSYAWSFGDGGTSPLQNPTHVFANAGTYHVTVKVTDLAHNTSTDDLTVVVTSGSAPTYKVTFTETGLPSGTSWSADLESDQVSSTTSTVVFEEQNGTYDFTMGSVSGYSPSPSSGDIKVSGAPVKISITFTATKPEYAVTFTETGLKAGTVWSVTLDGQKITSSSSSISFSRVEGTYKWAVSEPSGYTTTTTGSVVAHGATTVKIPYKAKDPSGFVQDGGFEPIGSGRSE